MDLLNYQTINVPKWKIKGNENYFFNTNKELIKTESNKFVKKRVKGYSVGYTINGKFTTLKNLKPLIESIKPKIYNIDWLTSI